MRKPETADAGGARSGQAMSAAQIEAFVKTHFWGVLATSFNDRPYAVPIIYGYDDGTFFIANGPGRKIETIQRNAHICLTIIDLEEYGKRWRSVVALGRAEMVEGITEKLSALNVLRKQLPRAPLRASDAARAAQAKVIRFTPVEITGRQIGY